MLRLLSPVLLLLVAILQHPHSRCNAAVDVIPIGKLAYVSIHCVDVVICRVCVLQQIECLHRFGYKTIPIVPKCRLLQLQTETRYLDTQHYRLVLRIRTPTLRLAHGP